MSAFRAFCAILVGGKDIARILATSQKGLETARGEDLNNC
jgi:hypothetical protein